MGERCPPSPHCRRRSNHPSSSPFPFFSPAVAAVPTSLILHILILISIITTTVGNPNCRTADCHHLYEITESALGIVMDEMMPTSPDAQAKVCVILRTYSKCLNDTASSCRSDLQFHSMHTGANEKLRLNRCSADGETFDETKYTPPPPPRARPDPCTYRSIAGISTTQEIGYRHCGLFGDPHLRTFNNEFQTCRVQGAWPLVDNDYVTVQVTNDPVGEWERMATATATSKVTVVVKSFDECGVQDFVTYQAWSGSLPSSFDDGRTHLGGQARNVQLTVYDPDRHVEIRLRYIDTIIIIRQVGSYFNVAVRMPEDLVKESLLRSPDGLDLCQKGCPRQERIDYKAILAYKNSRLKRLAEFEDTSAEFNMDIGRAQSRCRRKGLVDFYFDSCVFDLVTTGDLNFTSAAAWALKDLLALYPQGAALHKNRTELDTDNSPGYTSSASRIYSFIVPGHKNLLLNNTSFLSAIVFALLSILISDVLTSLSSSLPSLSPSLSSSSHQLWTNNIMLLLTVLLLSLAAAPNAGVIGTVRSVSL